MSTDDQKITPADLADDLLKETRARIAAVKAFQTIPRVQRMAANRSPVELRDEIMERVSALMAQLLTEVALLKESVETALADPEADKHDVACMVALCSNRSSGLAHIDLLVSVLRKVDVGFSGPAPDELQSVVFDHLAEEEDDEDGQEAGVTS